MQRPPRSAAHTPFRTANEKKPYVYQPYPAAMYHEDGRCLTVDSAEHSAILCPESEGWRTKRFPPKPIVPAEPEMTVPQMKDRFTELAKEHGDLKLVCAEQMAAIADLRAKLELKNERPVLGSAPLAPSIEVTRKNKNAKAE